jgi:hypothetical protein
LAILISNESVAVSHVGRVGWKKYTEKEPRQEDLINIE